MANDLAELIEYPGALDVISFAGDQVLMIETQILPESPVVGKRLLDVGLPRNVLLTGLLRGDSMVIPTGDHRLQANDRAFVVGKREGVLKAVKLLTVHTEPVRKVLLLGLGDIGLPIASLLEARSAIDRACTSASSSTCSLSSSLPSASASSLRRGFRPSTVRTISLPCW